MWRSSDESPDYFKGRKTFWCLVKVGSVAPKLVETKLSGYWTEHYGFIWSVSDWESIVGWIYLEEKEDVSNEQK